MHPQSGSTVPLLATAQTALCNDPLTAMPGAE
jgi:hypothetical protein